MKVKIWTLAVVSLMSLASGAQTRKRSTPLKAMVTASGTGHSVSLSWIASTSTGVSSYSVYRGGTSGAEIVYVTGISGASYVDTGVTAGLTYYYEVTAVCPALCNPVESVPSNEVKAIIPLNGQPLPPSGLTVNTVAKVNQTGYKDVLAWIASPTPSVVYRVYRSGTSGGPYTRIIAGLTNTTFQDKNTTLCANYFYVTTAYSRTLKLESVASNQVKAVIPTK